VQHHIDLAKCVSCDMCNQACPVDAVQIVAKPPASVKSTPVAAAK